MFGKFFTSMSPILNEIYLCTEEEVELWNYSVFIGLMLCMSYKED